jgi:hypothetical protein
LAPGVDFISIFGEKRIEKAQSHQQVAEKNRTLCAENLRSFIWHLATSEKQLFVICA